ncbi:hypothetical protein SDC9_76479 [bioreactor metagenome]|uniref:Uncharacterized protein n=1 Tax=bioreactor metagenome TaxID=1076179 RepID=A0A644YNS3_9ZZZZ
MGTGGEPLADKTQDSGFDAGELTGNFNIVDTTEGSTLLGGLVLPGNPEQVQWIDIPKPYVTEFCLDIFRYGRRIHHLLECRKQDTLLPTALDVLCAYFLIDIQIDQHAYFLRGDAVLLFQISQVYRKEVKCKATIRES